MWLSNVWWAQNLDLCMSMWIVSCWGAEIWTVHQIQGPCNPFWSLIVASICFGDQHELIWPLQKSVPLCRLLFQPQVLFPLLCPKTHIEFSPDHRLFGWPWSPWAKYQLFPSITDQCTWAPIPIPTFQASTQTQWASRHPPCPCWGWYLSSVFSSEPWPLFLCIVIIPCYYFSPTLCLLFMYAPLILHSHMPIAPTFGISIKSLHSCVL